MRVTCRICGEQIELNKDGPEARAKSQDPAQQLRRHCLGHATDPEMWELIRYRLPWLTDMMVFEWPERKKLYEVVDWIMDTPLKEKVSA